jgi:hypothetical protein
MMINWIREESSRWVSQPFSDLSPLNLLWWRFLAIKLLAGRNSLLLNMRISMVPDEGFIFVVDNIKGGMFSNNRLIPLDGYMFKFESYKGTDVAGAG